MILSRIELERSAPMVRRALVDSQQMHTLIMGLFGTSRETSSVLYRVRLQGVKVSVYIYSSSAPAVDGLLPGMTLTGSRDVSAWLASMEVGQTVPFDLLTMPARKVAAEGKNSQRRVLRTQTERLAWLARKAEQNGFVVEGVQEVPSARVSADHGAERGGRLYLDTYEYRGLLRITDAERFREAMRSGIGSGKAYGLGMLLLG